MIEIAGAAVVTVLVVLLLTQTARLRRRIAYLRGVAGPADVWDRPCGGCGRPIRDAAVLGITRAVGSGSEQRVFHLDRPACTDAADGWRDGH